MKKTWSSAWVASKQPRKQRKYRYNAPLHIKNTFLRAHLSKQLREKYGIRAVRVRVGDTVKILRGDFHGKEGKVNKTSMNRGFICVDGIERIKKDGSKVFLSLQPSNVMIISAVAADKFRFAAPVKKDMKSTKEASPLKKEAQKEEQHKEKGEKEKKTV